MKSPVNDINVERESTNVWKILYKQKHAEGMGRNVIYARFLWSHGSDEKRTVSKSLCAVSHKFIFMCWFLVAADSVHHFWVWVFADACVWALQRACVYVIGFIISAYKYDFTFNNRIYLGNIFRIKLIFWYSIQHNKAQEHRHECFHRKIFSFIFLFVRYLPFFLAYRSYPFYNGSIDESLCAQYIFREKRKIFSYNLNFKIHTVILACEVEGGASTNV